MTNIEKLIQNKNVLGLIKALKNKNENVREAAIVALGEIGKPAVNPLIGALKAKNNNVRYSATKALGMIGDGSAAPYLIRVFYDYDEHLRVLAAKSLGMIKNSGTVDYILDRLIGILSGKELEESSWFNPNLEEWMRKDLYRPVREAAAIALGETGDPRAVEPLTRALEDESGFVRERAARALEKIGDTRTVEPDGTEIIRKNAAKGIGDIKMGKNKELAHQEALKWWKSGEYRPYGYCDRCNKVIQREGGYLCKPVITGFKILGDKIDVSASPDLICEDCFDADPHAEPFLS